jgi:Family of unknown function (DUF5627)/Domain of unknown function (DUF1735)
MKKFLLVTIIFSTLMMGCNKDWTFPDYKYSTVYFAYQTPVRTLVLGEDIYDNSLDNQHKCLIMATMGGVYENKNDVLVNVALDKSLGARLKFETATGDTVLVMPDNYYSITGGAKGVITIPAGKFIGGLEVQLTDDFFRDPLSVKRTYVIPLKIQSVQNADSVLRGKSDLAAPDPRKPADWTITPKDYILYAVKYINPYHGFYLRRGVDLVTGNAGNTSLDTNVVYHAPYVEKDEVCSITTTALDEVSVSLNAKNKGNVNAPFTMLLKFDNQGKCTIRNPSAAAYTITGTGQFVKKADNWGNQQRDVLHLKYQIAFGTTTHNLTDTIVVRDRGVKLETFNPVVVN